MSRGINITGLGMALVLGSASWAVAQTATPPKALTPPAATQAPAAAAAGQPAAQPAASAPAPAMAPPAVPTFKPVVINPEDLQFLNAQADFRAHNYARAYLALLPMANNGDARAQYLLAQMSDNGLGPVQLDPVDAARWYTRAAEKNNADAQFALANAYSIGRGVPVNPQQAIKWLTRAADNGHVTAMMSLAGMYETGIGQPRNPEMAAEWTRRAAMAGSVNALYLYAVRLMLGEGVPKDEKTADLWMRRAAERGNSAAQLMLGRTVGDGLKASPEENTEAFMWLTLATRRAQGDIRAQAAQALRRLQPNMMPSDVLAAGQRAAAWKPMPQFAGLQPDPEYDLPGGLNNPLPPQPRNAAQGARNGTNAPAAGRPAGGG
ncbi:MAG TPA: tetratricopeptide repeat protein [Alphaproteobacteria bacterium]|nr:tetratricopeptide repeat protein [Alphaproteobacteria bacterium]